MKFTTKDFDNAIKTSARRAQDSSIPANSRSFLFGECSRYKAILFPGVEGVCLMVEDAETTDNLTGLPAVVFQSYRLESFEDLKVVYQCAMDRFNKDEAQAA